jgi:predicted enzyme related to lactoylglutathione lyase
MSNPIQTHGAFSWVEPHGGDSARAKEFDKGLLGWETEDMALPEMTYTVIANGADKIGGFPPMAAETPPGGSRPVKW